jgi:anti-sigma regulatory factor (Ser/Thr protein kinase)
VCHRASLDCGRDALAPSRARRFVRAHLATQLERVDPAEWANDVALIVTELVTNAARAARSTVILELCIHRHWIEIAVVDDGPGAPTRHSAGPLDTSGRGLSIVDGVASDWGVRMSDTTDPSDASGRINSTKTVWARLPLYADAPGSMLCEVA